MKHFSKYFEWRGQMLRVQEFLALSEQNITDISEIEAFWKKIMKKYGFDVHY